MDATIAEAFKEKGLTPVVEQVDNGGGSRQPGDGGDGGAAGSGVQQPEYIKEGKFDEPSFFLNVFGENSPFKTIDELKKFPDTLKEFETTKSKIKDYEAKLSEKRNPFVNDTVAKINLLSKETKIEDINLLSKLVSLDITKADAKTLLKLQKIMDNPEFSSKENLVEKMIDKQYNFASIDADENLDDDGKATEKELLQATMDIEANKIRKSLSEILGKAVVPKAEELEALELAEMGKAREGWSPIVSEIQKSLTKIQIPAGKFTVDFEVPAKSLEIIAKNALDFASKSFKGAVTQENAKALIDYVQTTVKLAHQAQINQKVMEYGRSLTEKEWIEQANNPSGFNKENKGGAEKSGKNLDDAVFDFFKNR
jgi:hypothetical protein